MALTLTRPKIPLICTSHSGDLYALQDRIFNWIKHLIINKSQALTVVSHALRQKAISLGAPEEKVQVIPMGVDLENTFVPDPEKPRSDNELLIGGRLVKKKGGCFYNYRLCLGKLGMKKL